MRVGLRLISIALTVPLWLAAPASGGDFSFSTGNPDGRLGALSRPASPGKIETETADDFPLTETTVLTGATVTGLIPSGTPLSHIAQVEVEVYHIFPLDSVNPPSGNVPTRVNSPSDVEIGGATRDSSRGTLTFTASVLSASFHVSNTVVNRIFVNSGGDGPATGEEVAITIHFTTPIILPAGHYFFRPEVLVTGGDFLYLSTAKLAVFPGTSTPDLQAWIRNSNLKPDWLRIGTDIIGGTTFNMTFSLTGDTVPEAGTPGQANCHGVTVSALAHQFGSVRAAASAMGASSVQALQDAVALFCQP
jgi:hypothetical protein